MKKKNCSWNKIIFHYLNFPKHLGNHLIGSHHTTEHRMSFGVAIMSFGVLLGGIVHDPFALSLGMHLIGSTIHGIGLIPVVEHVMEKGKEDTKKLETKQQEVLQ